MCVCALRLSKHAPSRRLAVEFLSPCKMISLRKPVAEAKRPISEINMSQTLRFLKMEQCTAEGEFFILFFFFSVKNQNPVLSPLHLATVAALFFNVWMVPPARGKPPTPGLIGHSARDSGCYPHL